MFYPSHYLSKSSIFLSSLNSLPLSIHLSIYLSLSLCLSLSLSLSLSHLSSFPPQYSSLPSTEPADYFAISTILTFTFSTLINVVRIPITNDNVGEVDEQFFGNLQVVPNSPVHLTRDVATVNIADDDTTSMFDS